jgi:glycosyltransferase involved in cell wall biosynthesis
MKVLVFCERLAPPFDEGIRNVAINLLREFRKAGHSAQAVTVYGADCPELGLSNLDGVNRALFSRRLLRFIRAFAPDRVCYVPTASMTSAAFLRGGMLRLLSNGAPVTMVVLQPRRLALWGRIVCALWPPDLVLTFSSSTAALLSHLGRRVVRATVGVDALRFSPLKREHREKLRAELGLPGDHRVMLHVGHLHRNRNLEPLKALQDLDQAQVLLAASSARQDADLTDELLRAGVRILQGQAPPVELIFGLSDLYVFTSATPSIPERSSAIDLPLSVFEAMACDLPVVTTRFGGLPDLFGDGPGFRYVSNPFDDSEWRKKVGDALQEDPGNNRQKVLLCTWGRLAQAALGARHE